jgi:UDP-glucose:(heptosyl)LPS alpha-1,3-glucosyltransferase
MNVALILERSEVWRGGAETSTFQFAQHLAGAGCRVTLVTTTDAPSTPELTVVPIKAPGHLRGSRTLLFANRAAEYVREAKFDVVHAITPCSAADVYEPRGGTVPETLARNLAFRSPLRAALKRIGQGLSLKYRVIANLERELLERQPPPWVIAISEYVAEQLRRHYRFDPTRVRLIFNGVDPDLSSPAERIEDRRAIRKQFGLAEDDALALCVAHNFKLKGVGRLIEALARVCANTGAQAGGGMYTVIVGRDNIAPYARLAERLGVANRVLFAGPTQRIAAFFHAADFLVHPTYYDPCSRVVLEAMAAGLPVITTRYNGAAERITEGREGYVVDSPADVEALADRMRRLADPAQRHACTNGAAAVDGFSMAGHAAGVLKLYEDVVREKALRTL